MLGVLVPLRSVWGCLNDSGMQPWQAGSRDTDLLRAETRLRPCTSAGTGLRLISQMHVGGRRDFCCGRAAVRQQLWPVYDGKEPVKVAESPPEGGLE